MNTSGKSPRNASSEAHDLVGPDWQPKVLEPSPPAVNDDQWFADDPAAVDDSDTKAILPAGLGRAEHGDWNGWLAEHPEHGDWVSRRWLGGQRVLPSLPDEHVSTRLALHRLAAYVIAPVRHQANGKFGLRWTLGGFGTPFFGADRQIRVDGTQLIDQHGTEVRTAPITSLQAAADFLGTAIDTETAAEHDSPPLGDANEQLSINAEAVDFLGNWYGMAFAALERARLDAASVDASRPQIWPGHFDPAIEIGDENHRGSYGASPGDHAIPEPYLYVSVWWPDRLDLDTSDPIWNAPSFTGAILKFADFPGGDPADAAASFFLSIRDRIQR